MAVVINKKINQGNDAAIAVYTDNYAIFSSSSNGSNIVKGQISITNGSTTKTFIISPDINNQIIFNAKEALISFFDFPDDQFDYQSTKIEADTLFKSFDFEYKLIYESVEEIAEELGVIGIRAKSFFKESVGINSIYLRPKALPTLFIGYPQSLTTLEDDQVLRKVLSTGLVELNATEYEKIEDKTGMFFKWLNSKGGYSYWLFSDYFIQENKTTKSDKVDKTNLRNYDKDKTNFYYSSKHENSLAIKVSTVSKDLEDDAIINSMLISEEIYLYIGEKGSGEIGNESWVKVSLSNNDVSTKAKKEFNKWELDVLLINENVDLIKDLFNSQCNQLSVPTNLTTTDSGLNIDLDWDYAGSEDVVFEIQRSYSLISGFIKARETKETETTILKQ